MSRSSALKIAPGLRLDADYVGGGTFGLLSKKGAGKSYLARVMAEEFWEARVPFVLLDPMGTSWGLRVSADGSGDGIPVAIFGGKRADAPLQRESGGLLADLVVDERLSMILDLSELGSRAAERQFALDFFERLYRRNEELVHLLIDEADLFAPQQPQAGDRPLLGVTENIVRRGRNRGIGITLITQRPAVLNKDVLTQVDGLVAMRITGLTDREAIDKWVAGHGDDPEEAAKVKATLAGLGNGECWWWVPELGVLKRVQVRASRTFDSSPTKKRGERRADPKGFADVDMGAIEAKMADTIERAKAEDPKQLRRQVVALKQQLAERPEAKVAPVEVPVPTPVIPDEVVTAALELSDGMEGTVRALKSSLDTIVAQAERLKRAIQAEGLESASAFAARQPPAKPKRSPERKHAPARSAARDNGSGHDVVTPARQRILDALASLEAIGVAEADKTQLALFAQASPKSSGYTNNLGCLRSAGLLDYPGTRRVTLTASGRELADGGAAPTSVEQLHAYVERLLPPARWRIVAALIDAYPEPLEKAELAERAGQSPTSSGYTNNLGGLRSLGLIDYPRSGEVVAQPLLFLEEALA
jgi:hypothetical protein